MSEVQDGGVTRKLDLDRLREGLPAITVAFGAAVAEAAAVCFDSRGHSCGVTMAVQGSYSRSYQVHWSSVTDQMHRCWADPNVATEHGAYGVAFLLIRELTDFTVIERSCTGTGFDYWLGKDNDIFQKKARLEVSGILSGDHQEVKRRVEVKKRQTKRSDGKLPAYVVVVEFGAPTAMVVKR
jgi:hypothetical protein